MNWEMFCAVIIWCIASVSVIAAIVGIVIGLSPDLYEPERKPVLTFGILSACIFVLSAATIGGMGWY